MQNPHTVPGYWVRLEKGIAKNYCPWGVTFDLQVLQIPTYAQVGEGLNIDRCISITCMTVTMHCGSQFRVISYICTFQWEVIA